MDLPGASSSAVAGTAGEGDAIAVTQRARASRDDFVAFVQAAQNLDDHSLLGSHLHGPEDGGVVLQLKHTAAAAQIDDGARGKDQRLLLRSAS